MATVPNENRQKHLKGIVDELKRSGAKQVDVLNDTVVVNANGKGHSAVQNRLNELTRNAQIKARDRAQAEEADDRLPASSKFKQMPVNPFVMAQVDRFSTFGIDTDTASYTLARRYIQAGYRPPAGSVRMEEFVNSFDYNYPSQGGRLFTTHAEAGPSPFGKKLTLVKVGVQAKTIGRAARKPAHLVFLVDASGSMDRDDRLPLAKFSLKTLVGQLGQKDRITLIAYGTRTHLVLDAASASDHKRIAQAIDSIQAGRSTNMIDALGSAYTQAKRHFKAGQINRVILCSDGVANIGATDAEAMLRRVETDRKQGVTLTTVGFGVGGYNDQLMEQLANRGDGQYVFVDSHQEARRVFVDQLGATLQTVAKDTKIQVEFNTSRVRRYRLVGYENRDIADKDFRNDKVDAGEVGSGQSATALYEVELVGRPGHEAGHDLGTVRIRYRDLETNKIEEIAQRLTSGLVQKRTPQTHPRFFLAASAAEFAEILRRSPHARGSRLAHVQRVMERVVRTLPLDKRAAELLNLIRSTEGLPDAP